MPDNPKVLSVFKLKTHIIQCSKIIEFFRQVAGCDHEKVLVSIRLIHSSTYTLGYGHLAGDKNNAMIRDDPFFYTDIRAPKTESQPMM
jgi:hypothetical protein